jgi:hypothetical protein
MNRESNALRVRASAKAVGRSPKQIRHVHALEIQVHPAQRHSGHVEEIFDHVLECFRVAGNRVRRLCHDGRISRVSAKHPCAPENHVQRRSQFVRQGRQKFVLEPIGGLCFPACVLLPCQQPRPLVERGAGERHRQDHDGPHDDANRHAARMQRQPFVGDAGSRRGKLCGGHSRVMHSGDGDAHHGRRSQLRPVEHAARRPA